MLFSKSIAASLQESSHSREPILWPSRCFPWGTSRLTAILRKATAEVWEQLANSRVYSQLTVGITEKHVQEVHESFNRFDDKSAAADTNVVFAWQRRHPLIQPNYIWS